MTSSKSSSIALQYKNGCQSGAFGLPNKEPGRHQFPDGYWTRTQIIHELKPICRRMKRFPTRTELKAMGCASLADAMLRKGGMQAFKKDLQYPTYSDLQIWTIERLKNELRPLVKKFGYIPSRRELKMHGYSDFQHAFLKYHGRNNVSRLTGFSTNKKRKNKFTEKEILQELRPLCRKLGRMPLHRELGRMGRMDLRNALHFQFNPYDLARKLKVRLYLHKPKYLSRQRILDEFKPVVHKLGHFPTVEEMKRMKRLDLFFAIRKQPREGFAKDVGARVVQHSSGYWNVDTLIEEILPIAEKVGKFPTIDEMRQYGRHSLPIYIRKCGGLAHIALTIARYIEEGKLHRKLQYATRFSYHAFIHLDKPTQRYLVSKDSYYRKLTR